MQLNSVQHVLQNELPLVFAFIIAAPKPHYDMLFLSLSFRQQLLPSETERHAIRTDDEVKMDAEDGNEPQRHQAKALQGPSYVLNWDRTEMRCGLVDSDF